jgi:hypothetical protein
MVSLTPKAMIKKLLPLSASIAGVGILLAPIAFAPKAEAIYYEREPGSFACENSLDPQCENPEREIGTAEEGGWACRNNPGPVCTEPPRVDQELEKGAWVCRFNQNTPACGNPIRYSVPESDRENWPTYFPEYSETESES